MLLKQCPKCGAKVAPSDTVCLDCGAELIEAADVAKARLQEQSVAGRTGLWEAPAVTGAQAGMAVPGEKSQDTRLKVFDQAAAAGLAQEALTAYITAGLTFIAGVILMIMAYGRFTAGASFSGLSLVSLRSLDAFGSLSVLAVIMGGTGLGGIAIGIGQFIRALGATQAVRDIKNEEKPTVVTLNPFLQMGLLLVAIFCPPIGLLAGLLLKLSDDSDIRGFAQMLIYASLLVIAVLVINMIAGAAAKMKPVQSVPGNIGVNGM